MNPHVLDDQGAPLTLAHCDPAHWEPAHCDPAHWLPAHCSWAKGSPVPSDFSHWTPSQSEPAQMFEKYSPESNPSAVSAAASVRHEPDWSFTQYRPRST